MAGSIEYYLVETKLNNQKGYVAKVVQKKDYNTKMLIDKMAGKGTSLTKTDIVAAFELFEETVAELLLLGQRVNLEGFMNFSYSISGVFEEEESAVDEIRGQNLKLNITPSRKFVQLLKEKARVKRIKSPLGGPSIQKVLDLTTQSCNSILTRGKNVVITGVRLRFNREMEDEGLFIEYSDTGKSIAIPFDEEPGLKRLKVTIPSELEPSDNVKFVVKSRIRNGNELRRDHVEGLRLV